MKSLFTFVLFATTTCLAQPIEFIIANGSSSGTYKKFTDELATITSDVITFKEVSSHGAIENLDLLINNKVMGAFMHSDVIYFRAQSTDLSKFKTLLALFSEDVHFLALRTSKRTSGGFLGFNESNIEINSLDDLKQGYRVGAAGGGYITSQVIRLQAQLPYEVIQFNSGAEVLKGLNEGIIDAAVFVGAAPIPNLVDLGPEYKLLPMGDLITSRLKSVYRPSSVTYSKMSPEPVSTVAADCLFVVREYTKTPKLINALKVFRTVFFERLGELQETPGFHPRWNEVSADNHGKWAWLEFK